MESENKNIKIISLVERFPLLYDKLRLDIYSL